MSVSKCFWSDGKLSKPLAFEKPLGMRDILPDMVYKKRAVLHKIEKVIAQWGYEPIETPTLEYYDTVGGVSSTMERRMFKLLDRTGRSLVLRPDLTAPIARVVASLLKEEPFPVRLYYEGNVFRAQEDEAGRNAEFPEVGIELIGEEAPDADAEVITLAVESLKAAGVRHFKLILGHHGLLQRFFEEVVGHEDEKALLKYLNEKNVVGYRQYVEQAQFTPGQKKRLVSLLGWRGGADILPQVQAELEGAKTKQALRDLQELWEVIELQGVGAHVRFDLSLLSHRDYYTGVFFEGYADKLGFPICSGGRYDHLLGQFGRPAPATGFALKVDRILEASSVPAADKKDVLLTYTEQERKEAFALARRLRDEGRQVTLHRLMAVQGAQMKVTDISRKADDFQQWIRLERGEDR